MIIKKVELVFDFEERPPQNLISPSVSIFIPHFSDNSVFSCLFVKSTKRSPFDVICVSAAEEHFEYSGNSVSGALQRRIKRVSRFKFSAYFAKAVDYFYTYYIYTSAKVC